MPLGDPAARLLLCDGTSGTVCECSTSRILRPPPLPERCDRRPRGLDVYGPVAPIPSGPAADAPHEDAGSFSTRPPYQSRTPRRFPCPGQKPAPGGIPYPCGDAIRAHTIQSRRCATLGYLERTPAAGIASVGAFGKPSGVDPTALHGTRRPHEVNVADLRGAGLSRTLDGSETQNGDCVLG
jgi:hypothetical protein